MMIDFLYFSGTHCSVCQALKPKLIEAITKSYPEVKIEVIDANTFPDIAAQKLVFTIPVALILVEGKEHYRFARSFSVSEVLDKLERLKSLYENN